MPLLVVASWFRSLIADPWGLMPPPLFILAFQAEYILSFSKLRDYHKSFWRIIFLGDFGVWRLFVFIKAIFRLLKIYVKEVMNFVCDYYVTNFIYKRVVPNFWESKGRFSLEARGHGKKIKIISKVLHFEGLLNERSTLRGHRLWK